MQRSKVYAAAGISATLALSGCGGGSGPSYGGGGSTTATVQAPATAPATVSATRGSLGTFLVDGQGRTLYLWQADTSGKSTCYGSCAASWPPLLSKGGAKAQGAARSGLLGLTTRSGGATQVSYAGHPLYRFAGDAAPGETNGQGSSAFGALWYVVGPSGNTITKH